MSIPARTHWAASDFAQRWHAAISFGVSPPAKKRTRLARSNRVSRSFELRTVSGYSSPSSHSSSSSSSSSSHSSSSSSSPSSSSSSSPSSSSTSSHSSSSKSSSNSSSSSSSS